MFNFWHWNQILLIVIIIFLSIATRVSLSSIKKELKPNEYIVQSFLTDRINTIFLDSHSNSIFVKGKDEENDKFALIKGRMNKSAAVSVEILTSGKEIKGNKPSSHLKYVYMNEVTKRNLKVWDGDIVTINKLENIKDCNKIIITPILKIHLSKLSKIKIHEKFILPNMQPGMILNYGQKHYFFKELIKVSAVITKIDPGVYCRISSKKPIETEESTKEKSSEIESSTEMEKLSSTIIQTKRPIEENKIEKDPTDILGGMDAQLELINQYIIVPLRNPRLYDAMKVKPPSGILLYGPPGTGKTTIARAVAKTAGASFHVINGPELESKFIGETEERLRGIFETARHNSPSIIFFDEIDSIGKKRGEGGSAHSDKVLTQLLTLMDGMTDSFDGSSNGKKSKIIIIAATNLPDSLDPALRRPGRFDREIFVGVPGEEGRLDILRNVMEGKSMSLDLNLREISSNTHGFTPSDLQSLCTEAILNGIKRVGNLSTEDQMAALQISKQDFQDARSNARPSSMRDVIEVPKNLKWEKEIGGLEHVRKTLNEIIDIPLNQSHIYTQNFPKTQPAKGVLLFGPPGCGKTTIAKVIASETGINFMTVKGGEFISKYIGETEKNIREFFKKARQASPCIVFFDEIDALARKRGGGESSDHSSNYVTTLLNEMDGMSPSSKVIILAATNVFPEELDSAITRPGRFDKKVYIGPPDALGRLTILNQAIKEAMNKGQDLNEQYLKSLVQRTDNYSTADMAGLVKAAIAHAINEGIEKRQEKIFLNQEHFEYALMNSESSVVNELPKYSQYMELKKKEVNKKKEKQKASQGKPQGKK